MSFHIPHVLKYYSKIFNTLFSTKKTKKTTEELLPVFSFLDSLPGNISLLNLFLLHLIQIKCFFPEA